MIYRIYAGVEDVPDLASKLTAIDHGARKLFGGFTRFKAHGGWRGDDGKEYLEPSVVYEIATDGETALAAEFAVFIRDTLNQQAVAFVAIPAAAKFI